MSEGYDTPRSDDDVYYERYREGILAWRAEHENDEQEDDELEDDETDSPDPEKT